MFFTASPNPLFGFAKILFKDVLRVLAHAVCSRNNIRAWQLRKTIRVSANLPCKGSFFRNGKIDFLEKLSRLDMLILIQELQLLLDWCTRYLSCLQQYSDFLWSMF